ncbi:clotting factor B-like [Cylas formicarius]|uniref:clotting factor B-like n=1 Tax=Cylas formicarius TaxID=197179 RepID=UPI00295887BE|nr:clotting factor B-like [Cylas formicarius]
MTAGHCLCTGIGDDLFKPTSLRVTLSQHDLSDKSTDAYERPVRSFNIHPHYSCSRSSNDIAILELDGHVTWSDSVIPACLPTERSSQLDNLLATVAGWGWTHEHSSKGGRAKTLQKAKVNVIGVEKCKSWYESQGKKTKVQPNQICAGHELGGIDACWADSGGPLMVETTTDNQMMVVGVVSTGVGCARPYLPGIYTRVSGYIPWIRSVIGRS